MRKMNQQELEQYERDGYTVLESFFPLDEVAGMNEVLDELEQTNKLKNSWQGDHGITLKLATLSPKTKAFCEDERVLQVLEDIVYPGIAIYSSKLVNKLPQSDTICHWHQDDAYYSQVGESKVRMSTWIPLQDATTENGCLWVVPGSHKLGLQPFRAQETGTCRLGLIKEEVDLSKAIPLEVKAGSLVLFSALLWHGSYGNRTDTVRRAFIVSYQEATIPQGNGNQWVILRPADHGVIHEGIRVKG